ncbi:neprilysin-2-like [Venturia canescens]|uniref:neprilysin-2-like n=1 Tax=Venturia canescens TaxID=32260 RepID=UPI001C9BCB02|nr:neprilysin-2-like [Venturia canescens]
MRSDKVKQQWTREEKSWKMGIKKSTVFGFLLFIVACNAVDANGTCTSEACSWTASTIQEKMQSRVEPCRDFYQFVCGRFLESAEIPVNQNSLTYGHTLMNDVREKLTLTLATEVASDEPTFYKLATKLYKSCMNPVSSGPRGLQAFKLFLNEFGGWPVLEGRAWNASNFDWRKPFHKFHRNSKYDEWIIEDGIGHLIGCNVTIDQSTGQRIIQLTTPHGWFAGGWTLASLDIPRSVLTKYYNLVVDLAVELGADKNETLMELREMIKFEIDLAKIKKSDQEVKLHARETIGEFGRRYRSVPWMEYITQSLPSDMSVTPDEIILVDDPEYYVKLEALMCKTSKRVQANYVLSKIAIRNAVYSSEKLRKKVYEYLSLKRDVSLDRNRTKWCTNQLMTNLDLAISGVYARKYTDEESRNNVIEMAKTINEMASEKWSQGEWLDNKTKTTGIEKSKRLTLHIGYPDELMNDTKLEKYHESLKFDEENFFENMKKLSAFDLDKHYKLLREPITEDDSILRIPTTLIDVLYMTKYHSIVMYDGILRGLYYDKKRPNYMNYGTIGTRIGNGITHGLFNDGRYFDVDGKGRYWWKNTATINFRERSGCISQHFKIYFKEEFGLEIDNDDNLPRNIRELGGVKLTYAAYKKWVAKHSEEEKMTGFEGYSPEKMFWISFASTQCALYEEEIPQRLLYWFKKAFSKYRVNGVLMNLQEFSDDFGCTNFDRMNPRRKCKVW